MTPRALSLIDTIAATRAEIHADPSSEAALQRLQHWQVERLRATYADYHSIARFRDALDFFVQDLYGPHDFHRRDRDLQRVMKGWHQVLPSHALESVTQALELEALSQSLDIAMARDLGEESLSPQTYAQAYRRVDRRRDREHQISLIVSAGRALDDLITRPWIAAALRAARYPARMAGVGTLQQFLERGYAAFAKMGSAEDLLRVIEDRETRIMKQILAGADDPFDIDCPAEQERGA